MTMGEPGDNWIGTRLAMCAPATNRPCGDLRVSKGIGTGLRMARDIAPFPIIG